MNSYRTMGKAQRQKKQMRHDPLAIEIKESEETGRLRKPRPWKQKNDDDMEDDEMEQVRFVFELAHTSSLTHSFLYTHKHTCVFPFISTQSVLDLCVCAHLYRWTHLLCVLRVSSQ